MADSIAVLAPAAPDTKSFNGSYLLYRKDGQKLRRPGGMAGPAPARPPRFRHPNFAAAEFEAQRLLTIHPASTFVVLQEVARVKLKEVANG